MNNVFFRSFWIVDITMKFLQKNEPRRNWNLLFNWMQNYHRDKKILFVHQLHDLLNNLKCFKNFIGKEGKRINRTFSLWTSLVLCCSTFQDVKNFSCKLANKTVYPLIQWLLSTFRFTATVCLQFTLHKVGINVDYKQTIEGTKSENVGYKSWKKNSMNVKTNF